MINSFYIPCQKSKRFLAMLNINLSIEMKVLNNYQMIINDYKN